MKVASQRPNVLFLPGAAGAGAFWKPVIEQLPSDWRMQAADLPGLGSVQVVFVCSDIQLLEQSRMMRSGAF